MRNTTCFVSSAVTLACTLLLGSTVAFAEDAKDVGRPKMTTSKSKTESGTID